MKLRRVAGVTLLAALTALATFTAAGCNQPDAQVAAMLEQAQAELAAQRYEACEQTTTEIMAGENRPDDAALALYLRAQSHLRRGQRAKARLDLKTAQPLLGKQSVRAIIDTQLGNIAFDDGAYARAANHYAGAIDHLPPTAKLDRVLYQYGLSLQRSGHFDEARKILGDLFRRFPTSKYALSARKKQAWSENYFTIQCGVFNQIDRAHKLAARLRQGGLAALAYPEIHDQGKRYVVRVGKYRDYSRAVRELQRVRQHQDDAFIVP